LFYGKKKIRCVIDSIYFISISVLPMLVWGIHNWLAGSRATSRELVIHLIPMKKIHEGIQVLLDWLFIPHNYPFILLGGVFGIAIIYVFTVKDEKRREVSLVTEVCFIFIFCLYRFIRLKRTSFHEGPLFSA